MIPDSSPVAEDALSHSRQELQGRDKCQDSHNGVLTGYHLTLALYNTSLLFESAENADNYHYKGCNKEGEIDENNVNVLSIHANRR